MRSARTIVVVPRALPSRMRFLGERLGDSGIEVVLDRRMAIRRRLFERRTHERRQESRRRLRQVVGYVFGCRIIRIDEPATMPVDVPVAAAAMLSSS
jgi:hypothetical protein